MNDMNSTTTLPGELCETNENENENEIQSNDIGIQSENETPKSADRPRKVPPKLHTSAKSQSMFDFSLNGQARINQNNPQITISASSPKYDAIRSGSGHDSLDEQVNQLQTTRQKSASADDFRLAVNPRRTQSIETNDDDDVDYETRGGRQLRIRSSIISLFARMGRDRRISNNSSNSNENDASKDSSPPLRALPQIAAQKILRAFSYVGKKIQ